MTTSLRTLFALTLLGYTALAAAVPSDAHANCVMVDPPCQETDPEDTENTNDKQIPKTQESVKQLKSTNAHEAQILGTNGSAGQAASAYAPPPPPAYNGPGANDPAFAAQPLFVKDQAGNWTVNGNNPNAVAATGVLGGMGESFNDNPANAATVQQALQSAMSGDTSKLGGMFGNYLAQNPQAASGFVDGAVKSFMSGNGVSALMANSGLASMLSGGGGMNISGLLNSVLGGGGASQLAQMLPQMGSLLQSFMSGSSSGMGSLLPSLASAATSLMGSGNLGGSSSGTLFGYSQPVYVPTTVINNYPQVESTTKIIYFLPSDATITPKQQEALQTVRSNAATQAAVDAYTLAQTIRQTHAERPGVLSLVNGNALRAGTVRTDVQANTAAAITLHRQQLDASAILAMLIEQRATELLAKRASLSR